MKKRWMAGMTTVAIAACMFTGCSFGAPTASSLIEDAQNAVSDAESVDANVKTDITMSGSSIEESGRSSMELSMDLDTQTTKDPEAAYIKGSVSVTGVSFDLEMYETVEDSTIDIYTQVMNQWTHSTQTYDEDKLNAVSDVAGDISKVKDSFTLAEETQDVNGTTAYILNGTISGEDIADLLTTTLEAMGSDLSSSGIDSSELEDLSVDVEYAIAKEDKTPLYTKLTFTGLDSVSTDELTIDKMEMEVTYNSFDTVDTITVPDEAKENATDIDSSLETTTETAAETAAQ